MLHVGLQEWNIHGEKEERCMVNARVLTGKHDGDEAKRRMKRKGKGQSMRSRIVGEKKLSHEERTTMCLCAQKYNTHTQSCVQTLQKCEQHYPHTQHVHCLTWPLVGLKSTYSLGRPSTNELPNHITADITKPSGSGWSLSACVAVSTQSVLPRLMKLSRATSSPSRNARFSTNT